MATLFKHIKFTEPNPENTEQIVQYPIQVESAVRDSKGNVISETYQPKGNYITSIPVATSAVLGGIKVGSGLKIDDSGVLSTNLTIPTKVSQLANDAGYINKDVASLTNFYTKTQIDGKLASAVDYLGTVEAVTGLSTTAGRGDFYRASASFTLSEETVHTGDLLIALRDNPTQDNKGWDVAHIEIDSNTWVKNTSTADGYVTKGSGQINKVWKTDASGNPSWMDDGITGVTITRSADGNTITFS